MDALQQANSADQLAAWHRAHLAKTGNMAAYIQRIRELPPAERKEFGMRVNATAKALEAEYVARRDALGKGGSGDVAAIDVTLPGRPVLLGRAHPVRHVLNRVCDVFSELGFEIFESPHVETDTNNFGMLNMPEDHPAREMQDTFYVSDSVLLRTHTSAGQVRAMRKFCPEPIRVLLPGLCYRNEDLSARSEIQFHQVEGLVISRDVAFSDLKGLLNHFARSMFGSEQRVRFRGSYFPFTEPSVEVDIRCTLCGGDGCRVCKYTGWLELLGAGLVHPTVLKNGGYDPEQVQGVAFGMGIERMVMLQYGLSDIRVLFSNDEDVLSQLLFLE